MTSASRLLLLLGALLLAGCDSDAGGPAFEGADAASTESGEDAVQSTPDAEESLLDADVEGSDPPFVLGVNITGQSVPNSFSELPEGNELLVEYGPQGLWMVVLAFKTKGLFEEPLLIKASVESQGMLQGEFTMTGQELLPGPGGYAYFYNFFLVVSDPQVAGSPGIITLSVTDDAGYSLEVVRSVALVGGLATLEE